MIRRGFWMAVGAAGGIMAYRRVASFGRRVSGTPGSTRLRGDDPPSTPRRELSRARVTTLGVARETIRFTRDVREGMDDYMARHPGRPGPTLGANTDHTEKDDR
jgi:hypothetical protein